MIRVSHLSKPRTVFFLVVLFRNSLSDSESRRTGSSKTAHHLLNMNGFETCRGYDSSPYHPSIFCSSYTNTTCMYQANIFHFTRIDFCSRLVLFCPIVFMYSVSNTVSPDHLPQLPLSQFHLFRLYVVFTQHYCLVCHTGYQPNLCHFVLFCQKGKTYFHSYPHIVSIRSAISGYTKHFEMHSFNYK